MSKHSNLVTQSIQITCFSIKIHKSGGKWSKKLYLQILVILSMKTLYIIRHAKAEHQQLGQTDFDRSLTFLGTEQAQASARILERELAPYPTTATGIITSDAPRALQTAEIFCETLNIPPSALQQEPRIYEAHYLQILKVINDISANYDQVLLFGHNPGLSDLITYVTNSPVSLRTSEIGCLTLDEGTDFSTLSANTASLKSVIGR
ncbi:phosphohistidine phosphatase [Sphingobacterium psychroaquaticum]|nr:phosphohistidine phosphatase [Sphingobacterium psychroaquaticum]